MTDSYRPYIILSTPRSGSNYLAHLLNSHLNIMSYGEPFQPDFLLGNPRQTLFENPLIYVAYKRLRSRYPIFFIKHLIYKKYPKHISAVGFKIFYEHAQMGYLKFVWPYLKTIPDLHVIHLKRRNLLKSYVSYKIALITDQFVAFHTPRNKPTIKLALDYGECVAYFHSIEQWRKKYEIYFSGKQILPMYYEDLCTNATRELNTLEEFLAVPRRKLSCSLKKQNLRSLRSIINNYSSLQKRFSQTPWAHFFD